MTCGIPTVYSTRGSGPELIDHGVDGMLADPGDPSSISRALVKLLTSPETAERIGEAGRRKVLEQFSMAAILPQNVRYYESVMGK
jgi:glycosyltransferase involved in cell wall biosynthesis